MNNQEIARRLLNHARDLDADRGSLYEMRAYRQAAETMLRLEEPAERLVALGGRKQLETLPGIGAHLSYTIEGLIRTGEFRTHPRSRSRRRMPPSLVAAHSYPES